MKRGGGGAESTALGRGDRDEFNEDNLDYFLVNMGDDDGNVRGGGYKEGEGGQGIVSCFKILLWNTRS